jgi:hypothetical protein
MRRRQTLKRVLMRIKSSLAVFVRRISRAAILGALVAFVTTGSWSAAHASVIFSDFGPGNTVGNNGLGVLGPSSFIGQHDVSLLFTAAAAGDVSQIDIALQNFFGSTGATVSLWTDASNALGTRLGSWSFTAAAFNSGNTGAATISGIGGVHLDAATSYFISASAAGNADDTWRFNNVGASGELILGGEVDYGTLGTFDILGADVSATPLPSTWVMLLGGLLGLGFFAHSGSKMRSAAIAAA